MKKRIGYLLLGIIIITGAFLRNHNLNIWPREGATFDEFAWTFLGVSLWDKGIPTSWSPHPEYTNKVVYHNPRGARFVLVTPYLEHPPLFGLVAGGFAMMRGVRSFNDVTVSKIRPLALAMGTISILMVFLLASSLYGDVVGLVAAGMYAVVPSVVIGSRLVQNENFFIPFFLLALYLTQRYLTRPKAVYLVIISIICGLLPWAKIPWLAAPVAVIGVFLFSKKWKEAVIVAVAAVVSVGLFLVYGLVLDKSLFLSLWKLQLARYDMTFDSLFIVLRDPVIVDRALVDGWIYIGWAAVIWLLTRDVKKHLPVIMGFLAYAAVFVFAIPSEPLHGWYRYPFYPFLVIAIAVYLVEYVNKNYFATAVFYIVTGLSMFAGGWNTQFGFSFPVFRSYLALVAVGAIPGLFSKFKNQRIFKYINYALMVIIVLLTVLTVIFYNEQ